MLLDGKYEDLSAPKLDREHGYTPTKLGLLGLAYMFLGVLSLVLALVRHRSNLPWGNALFWLTLGTNWLYRAYRLKRNDTQSDLSVA
jgi:hypothetical protein